MKKVKPKTRVVYTPDMIEIAWEGTMLMLAIAGIGIANGPAKGSVVVLYGVLLSMWVVIW